MAREEGEQSRSDHLSEYAFAFGSKPAELEEADSSWPQDLPPRFLKPDSRWQDSMVGTKEDLEAEARRWEQGKNVPDEIARMLGVSRNLFVHSYFVHEFAVVSVVWSLLAVEASLRSVLGDSRFERKGLKKLTDQARERNLLTEDELIQLNAGREFRNSLVHTKGQSTFTLGMTVPLLEVGHSLVARLFERAGDL